MSIDELHKASPVKILTNGNNFWVKLRATATTPRETFLIQSSVNAGGGVRGQKTDYFVILNISKDTESLAHLGQLNIQLIYSHLLQNAPVHESVLKGILSQAKKGDRRLVNLGGGLVLGQIDLMKLAFPHILHPHSPHKIIINQEQEKHIMPTESSDLSFVTWQNLGSNISNLLAKKTPNPVKVDGLKFAPSAFTLGAIALDIQNTSPVARFEIPLNNFDSSKSKIEDKIRKLTPGQYIRVVVMPMKANLFIGDVGALTQLARGVAVTLTTTPARVTSDLIAHRPASVTVENQTQPSSPESNSAPQSDSKPSAFDGTGNEVIWTKFYTKYSRVAKALESKPLPEQFGAIQYRGASKTIDPKTIAIFVKMDLLSRLGLSVKKEDFAVYQSSEVMDKNIEMRNVIEEGKPVLILKLQKPYIVIYPINAVPDLLDKHMQVSSFKIPDIKPKSDVGAPPPVARTTLSVKDDGTVDMSLHTPSQHVQTFGWSQVRTSPATIVDTLLSNEGYAFIKKHAGLVGLAVSNKFVHQSGCKEGARVSFSSTEIGDSTPVIIGHLEKGEPLAITRFNATQFAIYPIQSVPKEMAEKIYGVDIQENNPAAMVDDQMSAAPVQTATEVEILPASLPQEPEESVQSQVPPAALTPATAPMLTLTPAQTQPTLPEAFKVAAAHEISVPQNLAERIKQRREEDAILARVAEVRQLLNNPNTVAAITWDSVKLNMISNPTLIENVPALAEHFKLEAQEILSDDPENIGLVHAFEKAISYKGLIVFRPAAGEQPILLTSNPDFFANFARDFC